MKKLTKLEKFGLISAIVVCGSFFYLKKVYDPEAAALKRTVTKLNETIAAYNKLEEPPALKPIKKQVAGQQKILEELTSELKNKGGRTGNASEVTIILTKINKLAKEHRLQVQKIIPAGEIEEQLFTWSAFTMQINCNFKEFVVFIKDLKELNEPIQLRGTSLERDESADGRVNITTTLLL